MVNFEIFGIRVAGLLLAIIPALVFLAGQIIAYNIQKPLRAILVSLWVNSVLLIVNTYLGKNGLTVEAAKAGITIIFCEIGWLLSFKRGELKAFYKKLHSDKKERRQAIILCINVFVICVIIIPLIGALVN